ncbi:hypothetical protein [Streptomyces uncialis]|uniref:hypothetical protein n=1 Tax=Streptomyces uncialis TaxID=1048205 RepID=UPI002F90806F|nr:hypothetical protein OG268_37105 [Streptomyces uncialis]
MRRYRYRCTVCRTTSPVVLNLADLAAEGSTHRLTLHGGHIPDDEAAGEVDRLGRWYATLPPLTAMHARIADGLSDLRDPKGMGRPFWASGSAALVLGSATALTLLLIAAAL